jgi:hypothetical protein
VTRTTRRAASGHEFEQAQVGVDAVLHLLIAVSALYLLALVVLVTGTFGLFGEETDPLSGVFLMPLGLPWNRMIDFFPEPLWPWLAAVASAVNFDILWRLCRRVSRSRPGLRSILQQE